MLTKIIAKNFKQLKFVEIELGNPVVFIGPNNSGKTTALQALSLWHIGLRRWQEKYKEKEVPANRTGVTINRQDLFALPIPNTRLLWHNLKVRQGRKSGKKNNPNIRIEIIVEGVSNGVAWNCGFEFDYANAESFYCRRIVDPENPAKRLPVPAQAALNQVAFLPPMSGLSDREFMKQRGEVELLIGQGRTAEVLRNLCFQIVILEEQETDVFSSINFDWTNLVQELKSLFGVQLNKPKYIPERAEITMSFVDANGIELDISSSGRGLQQTLLLLAYMCVNPQSILLLDEPDAHLEILRQRQIYRLLSSVAQKQNSQIVAASHSEIILNEAADRDVVIAFVGKPHRMDNRGSQVLKSLSAIGFDQYYQAEQNGWVLYLEGSTDLSMLQSFAEILNHPAKQVLERPFVHYVLDQTNKAQEHFYGLKEAKSDLVGFALYDHLQKPVQNKGSLRQYMWDKCEFENYLCTKETLLNWARNQAQDSNGPLFEKPWVEVMEKEIHNISGALATLGQGTPWDGNLKVSDHFLKPLFENFYKSVNLQNLMRKGGFYNLVQFVPQKEISPEIKFVLDQILEVANLAKPANTMT